MGIEGIGDIFFGRGRNIELDRIGWLGVGN